MSVKISNHLVEGAKQLQLRQTGALAEARYVVIHYTAGASLKSSISTLKNLGYGYHLMVDRDGTIVQGAPLNRRVSHAGLSNFKGTNGLNSYGIGICAANYGWLKKQSSDAYSRPDTPKFSREQVYVGGHKNGGMIGYGWEKYPDVQTAAIANLIEELVAKYPTIRDITTHDEVSVGRKQDPGPAFPLDQMRALCPQRDQYKGVSATVDSPDGLLSLRKGPGSRHSKIKNLQSGDQVWIRSEAYKYVRINGKSRAKLSGWVSVDTNGNGEQDGFVFRRYLK